MLLQLFIWVWAFQHLNLCHSQPYFYAVQPIPYTGGYPIPPPPETFQDSAEVSQGVERSLTEMEEINFPDAVDESLPVYAQIQPDPWPQHFVPYIELPVLDRQLIRRCHSYLQGDLSPKSRVKRPISPLQLHDARSALPAPSPLVQKKPPRIDLRAASRVSLPEQLYDCCYCCRPRDRQRKVEIGVRNPLQPGADELTSTHSMNPLKGSFSGLCGMDDNGNSNCECNCVEIPPGTNLLSNKDPKTKLQKLISDMKANVESKGANRKKLGSSKNFDLSDNTSGKILAGSNNNPHFVSQEIHDTNHDNVPFQHVEQINELGDNSTAGRNNDGINETEEKYIVHSPKIIDITLNPDDNKYQEEDLGEDDVTVKSGKGYGMVKNVKDFDLELSSQNKTINEADGINSSFSKDALSNDYQTVTEYAQVTLGSNKQISSDSPKFLNLTNHSKSPESSLRSPVVSNAIVENLFTESSVLPALNTPENNVGRAGTEVLLKESNYDPTNKNAIASGKTQTPNNSKARADILRSKTGLSASHNLGHNQNEEIKLLKSLEQQKNAMGSNDTEVLMNKNFSSLLSPDISKFLTDHVGLEKNLNISPQAPMRETNGTPQERKNILSKEQLGVHLTTSGEKARNEGIIPGFQYANRELDDAAGSTSPIPSIHESKYMNYNNTNSDRNLPSTIVKAGENFPSVSQNDKIYGNENVGQKYLQKQESDITPSGRNAASMPVSPTNSSDEEIDIYDNPEYTNVKDDGSIEDVTKSDTKNETSESMKKHETTLTENKKSVINSPGKAEILVANQISPFLEDEVSSARSDLEYIRLADKQTLNEAIKSQKMTLSHNFTSLRDGESHGQQSSGEPLVNLRGDGTGNQQEGKTSISGKNAINHVHYEKETVYSSTSTSPDIGRKVIKYPDSVHEMNSSASSLRTSDGRGRDSALKGSNSLGKDSKGYKKTAVQDAEIVEASNPKLIKPAFGERKLRPLHQIQVNEKGVGSDKTHPREEKPSLAIGSQDPSTITALETQTMSDYGVIAQDSQSFRTQTYMPLVQAGHYTKLKSAGVSPSTSGSNLGGQNVHSSEKTTSKDSGDMAGESKSNLNNTGKPSSDDDSKSNFSIATIEDSVKRSKAENLISHLSTILDNYRSKNDDKGSGYQYECSSSSSCEEFVNQRLKVIISIIEKLKDELK